MFFPTITPWTKKDLTKTRPKHLGSKSMLHVDQKKKRSVCCTNPPNPQDVGPNLESWSLQATQISVTDRGDFQLKFLSKVSPLSVLIKS